MQFAAVIKGIISQRLVAKADGNGRVPAAEVLIGTLTIREAIIDEAKTRQIPSIIAGGQLHYGMQTYDEALLTASNPDDFILKVKGIQSTSDLTFEAEERKRPGPGVGSGPGPVPGQARPGGFGGAPKPAGEAAKEWKPPTGEGDFKIDRFGDK
jgi:twitching motility protein PilT